MPVGVAGGERIDRPGREDVLQGFEAAERSNDGDQRLEARSVRVVLEPGNGSSRQAGPFGERALGEVLGETFGAASPSEFIDHLIVSQHEPRHRLNVSCIDHCLR